MARRLSRRLAGLARRFPPGSAEGRQVKAALSYLKRGGIGNFIWEYESVRADFRKQAQTLTEIKLVALLSYFIRSAYAAAGRSPGAAISYYPAGGRPDYGFGCCPFCEEFLDAVQRCFGCGLALCTSCDTHQPHSPYPLCAKCAPVWTWWRLNALFAAFLLLPHGERTDERFDRLQHEVGALSMEELELRGWLPAGANPARAHGVAGDDGPDS